MMGIASNLKLCEFSLWILFITMTLHFEVTFTISSWKEKSNLELGEELLLKGRLFDALSHFHIAIDLEQNYLGYYKRAITYIALAKSKSALPDLNEAIALNPEFRPARIQRGLIFIKQGKLEEAMIDFQSVLKEDPNNQEALEYYYIIGALQRNTKLARTLIIKREYNRAIEILNKVLEQCPWDPTLYELRVACHILVDDKFKAINDFKVIAKLRVDSAAAYYEISFLYYQLGETDAALSGVRECLKHDPEQRACQILYKKVKKLAAHIKLTQKFISENRYKKCVEASKQILEIENQTLPYILRAKTFRCHCHLKAGESNKALSICTEALSIEKSGPVLCDRAEAFITYELYDRAIRDYKRALEIDENLECAKDGLCQTQKLRKMYQARLEKGYYYGILNVERTDGKDAIAKAYRKLALSRHPDHFQGKFRKIFEREFIVIADAKEVLTDPGTKRRKLCSFLTTMLKFVRI